ncbi:MAG: LacI family DNA-binding transcriptional regulator [Bacteroidota bacterium]
MARITSKDVAKIAGVSRTTVSLVLNGVRGARISEATRDRVVAVARELGYAPNVLAQSLKTKRSRIIGLIVPSITNPFFPAIAQGVEDMAVERGYNVFFCNSYRDPGKEQEYVLALCQKQVEGVIFASVQHGAELAGELRQRGVAVVLFDRRAEIEVDTVSMDNVAGAALATKHLLAHGRRRIAFLSGPLRIRSRMERWEGYRQQIEGEGLRIAPELVREGRSEHEEQGGVYELELGYSLTRELIAAGTDFDGIFAVNDMTAIGALRALREYRRAVPGDVAVVGFDNLALSTQVEPPLTTISQPQYEMGTAAAGLLFDRLDDPGRPARQKVFQPELVVRGSSCSVAAREAVC